MVYIGCDQHKNFCQLAILDQKGAVIEEKKIYHDDRSRLKDYLKSLPEDSQMAIEASGFDHGSLILPKHRECVCT